MYYLLDGETWLSLPSDASPIERLAVWHWCTAFAFPDEPGGRWALASVAKHDLIGLEPLHLEPSILWCCCGKHGFIRGGVWTDS